MNIINNSKKNNAKSLKAFLIVASAMGTILFFSRSKLNLLLLKWILFCLVILALYFGVIELIKLYKQKKQSKNK